MSSREAAEELCRQVWNRPNQMQQQEERQTFRSDPHIPPEVQSKIKSYLREDPSIISRDVRDRLIKEGIYDVHTAPSVSAISQSMRRSTEYIQFRDESSNDNRDPTTGDASSRPLQALEQLASRGTTGSSQVPKRHVHSVDLQQQQLKQDWFMQQHILMLQRTQKAALATQQQVPNVTQQEQQWFAQQQMLALQRELQLAAARQQAAAVAEDRQFTQLPVPPYRQWRSVKLPTLDELLKNENCVQTTEEKSPVVGVNDGIDNVNAVGASVKPTNVQTNCQAKTPTDMFLWPSLEELFPTQRRVTSQMMKMMRTPSQTTDCSGAAESILASDTEKQEKTTDIDPPSKKISLKDETLMAELKSEDQRQFQIEIGRRVDELSSAVEELRLKTTHLESEKSRLKEDVRSLTSQLDQQSLNSSESTRDGITPGASKSSSENVPSLSRHEKALTSIASCSNAWGCNSPDELSFLTKEEEFSKIHDYLSKSSRENVAQEAEKIVVDDKNNKKSLDARVDQLTANMEKIQKTLDRFVTLYEPEKLQTLVQRDDEEKRKKEAIATKGREDKLKMEIKSLKSQRHLEEIKSVRENLQWEAEREKLQKQLQHYESLSHKGQTDSSSTQIIPEHSNDVPKSQDTTEDNTKSDSIYMESFRQILKHYKEKVWDVSPQNVRKSTNDRQYENHAPELKSQTTIPPPCAIVEDHRRGHLRQRFMFLLATHSCENLDCSIVAFEKTVKHASKCTKGSKCNRHICKYAHTRIEHLKVGDDEGQCKLRQPYSYVDEDVVQGMMTILESGCPMNRKGPIASTMKEAIVNMVAWQAVRYGMVGDQEKTVDKETPKLNEMIAGQSSDSSSDVEEASGWEIVKSESRREVLV